VRERAVVGLSLVAFLQEVIHFVDPPHNDHDGMNEDNIREHEEVTKVKVCVHTRLRARARPCMLCSYCLQNINHIELGRYRMETWYFSPFPKEYYAEGVVDTVCPPVHVCVTCRVCIRCHVASVCSCTSVNSV
jgi:hypothetical protein